MPTTSIIDNTIHFQKYNSGGIDARQWQESPYFLKLNKQRRKRSVQLAKEAKQRKKCRELQQMILQQLLGADRKPIHVNNIAEHIGRSPQATARFLSTHADDLWISVNGGSTWWVTSLRRLPDRLFY